MVVAGIGSVARAELPSVKIGRGDLVSLSAADSYYGAATTHTYGIADSIYRSPEVKAMARALDNDVDLIYAFVKSKIEITPLFGLQKGALGTLIDRHGTAFDQADLMVALLREAGYTANYQYGEITLTGVQFAAWLGVDNGDAAEKLLAYGGIPATVTGTSSSLSSVTMKHVWVTADIGGVTYHFDPSYKLHDYFDGIDLLSAMGYSRSSFTNGARGAIPVTGADSGVSYIKDISPNNIASNLKTYSSNLLTEIKTNHHTKPLHEIIGGEKIITEEIPVDGWRMGAGDYVYTLTPDAIWSDVPDQFRTKFNVFYDKYTRGFTSSFPELEPFSDPVEVLFYVDEIYGRKLEIDPSGGAGHFRSINIDEWHGKLSVDGVVVMQSDGTEAKHSHVLATGGRLNFYAELSVDHPYAADGGAYMDQVSEHKFDVVSTAHIVHGWGDVSQELMNKWHKEHGKDGYMASVRPADLDGDGGGTYVPKPQSKQDNTKAKLAAGWLAQFSKMADMAGNIAGASVLHHHTVGMAYAETHIATDCKTNNTECYYQIGDQMMRLDLSTGFSAVDDGGRAANEEALIHMVTAAAATLEGSVFEQQLDSVDTASTAERFNWAETELVTSSKYYWFKSSDEFLLEDLILQEGYDRDSALLPVYIDKIPYPDGHEHIRNYLLEGYEVLAVNDEFLGPGYEYGPKRLIGLSSGFKLETASLQRGAAFIAIKKDINGIVTDIAHVVTTRDGVYKGGSSSVANRNEEEFDPAQSADILKDEFEDRSVVHGVDLASGNASWSSGEILSAGSGSFPHKLSLDIKLINNDEPTADRTNMAVKHWRYAGVNNGQIFQDNMESEATISGSGLEAMGASHPWNAVGTIAALYAAYDVALEGNDLNSLVLLPFINHWWAKQLTYNVVSISSPNGGYQFVRLPDGAFNAPPGSAATLAQGGSRVAVRDYVIDQYVQQRRWTYNSIDLTVTTPDKTVLVFDAYSHLNSSLGDYILTLYKHYLKSATDANGFAVNFTYENGNYNHGIRLIKISNDFGRMLNWVYDASAQYKVNSINNGNGHSVTFTSQNGREGFTAPDGGFYGFEAATPAIDARPIPGFMLGKVYLPGDSTNAALEYSYNEAWQVKTVKDAEAVLGTRGAYEFKIAEGFHGERVDPGGDSYTVWYGLYDGMETVNDGREDDYGLFVDEAGRVVKTEFGDWGRVSARQYPEGNRVEFAYDNYNNVIQKSQKSKDGAQTISASATYSDSTFKKLPTSVTDANGHRTDLDYYGAGVRGAGQVRTATRPADAGGVRPVYTYEYNVHGQLTKITDPEGMVTLNSYDASGNLASMVVDSGGLNLKTVYFYDTVGNLCRMIDPRGSSGLMGGHDAACDN